MSRWGRMSDVEYGLQSRCSVDLLLLRLSTLKGILEARERARAKYGSVPQGGLALTREMLPTYLCGPAASLSCVQPLRLPVSQARRARDGPSWYV